MKIVISGYLGKKVTGIGRAFIETFLEVAAQYPETQIVIYTNIDNEQLLGCKLNNFSNVNIKTYKVSKASSIKNLLWHQIVFPFIVLKEKADVVYIPNFTLLLFKVRPTVVVIHDLIEFRIKNKFSKFRVFYRKLTVPLTARNADFIITVSKNSKKDIVELCGVNEKKIAVIYNAVNRILFKSENNSDDMPLLNEKDIKKPYILFVGTVDHPGKNVYSVIKAFEVMKDKSDIKQMLYIVGMPGKGHEIIEDAIQASRYKNKIEMLGYVEDDLLAAMYRNADCFVFPSLYEGFGIPPLEAMSCGCPTIVASTSSLLEVVGVEDMAVDPFDTEKLAKKISDVLFNEATRKKYKEHGLKQALKFNWEETAMQTMDIIKRI